MWIVRLALRRPYTFVVMAILIAILGGTAIVTMPVDIFPVHRYSHCECLVGVFGSIAGGDGEAGCYRIRA